MKRNILTIIFCILASVSFSQKSYYYYNAHKHDLTIDNSKEFILVNVTDTNVVKEKISQKLAYVDSFKRSFSNDTMYWSFIHKQNIEENIDAIKEITYSSPFVLADDNTPIGISNLFYVKLNSLQDTNILRSIAKDVNVEIIKSNELLPLWFTLSCSKFSQGNALQMSNYFFETNFFAATEPDFMEVGLLQCSNDLLFTHQWGLNNSFQYNSSYDFDINYCNIATVTDGCEDIIVAVIDEGVDTNHPDITNLHEFSIDATTGTTPSHVYSNHGTACAGIIGATANNNIGISGIASNSPIMSISYDFHTSYDDLRNRLSTGFLAAANNGASVINCSWLLRLNSNFIEDAIESVTTRGRNGKGCVVVFASGNQNNSSVSYPSSLSSVMSVGAISPCGERKNPSSCDGETNWGSNYGNELDVVAPGVLITTTNIHGSSDGDYVDNFTGTSAACPFVSGVAALVLSANQNLTQKQVRDIIEQTAQKIRPDLYNYTTYPQHPNGTWNAQMGYGLIDAYAAVMKAKEMDLYIRDVNSDDGSVPSYTNGCMWNSPDIWIEDLDGNIIENPIGGEEYNVCVRVHNKKNIPSTGEETLYLNWAKAGIDLRWNDSWDGEHFFDCGGNAIKGAPIAESVPIPSIAANGSSIVKVNWTVPRAERYASCTEFENELWHFCLVARVHDGNDIINENNNNADMAYFVENNNNVAWKNLSVLNSRTPVAVVSVSNPYSERRFFKIAYTAKPNSKHEYINQFSEVYLHLSNNLNIAWKNGNAKGVGLKQVGENAILLTDTTAVLDSILLNPEELYTLKTKISFLTQKNPEDNEFDFDLSLFEIGEKEVIIGGEHYLAIKDRNRDFKAIALSDTVVLAAQPISFSAASISENAEYVWYNANGDTISTQQTLQIQPISSEQYRLEVVSQYDGAKDYDTVTAIVKNGFISNISPNPASSNISVSYNLSDNTPNATIQIVNSVGMVLNSTNITKLQTRIDIDVNSLINGHYNVNLVLPNGDIVDSKTLLIQ